MRKISILVAVFAALMIICAAMSTASYAGTEKATVPSFDITLNGMHVDNASRKYPLLEYRGITYFPMTYNDCRYLGITTEWSAETGLSVNKSSVYGEYKSDDVLSTNQGSVDIVITQEPVTVNGTAIDNSSEQYPLFIYRSVTYFPLTWRFAIDEFGWNKYEYTDEKGLVICSKEISGDSNSMPAKSFASGATYYDNKIDGYNVMLPAGVNTDVSMQEICTSFETANYTLDVFRQDCDSAYAVKSYISYSNSFTSDTVNFTVTDSGKMTVNGLECSYLIWNRAPFTVVKNDRNKYACFDIVSGTTVYTMEFRYNDSISLTKDLLPVVFSFNLIPEEASAPAAHVGNTAKASMNESAAEVYEKVFTNKESFTWGIFDMRAMTDLPALRELEAELDYEFPIQLIYSDFRMHPDSMMLHGDKLVNKLNSICDNGQVPELTLQTTARDDGKNMVFCALRGEYDDFLHSYAKQVVEFGQPVLFRFGNEMNGDWCPYSGYNAGRDADAYVELYKYIYEIFQQEGADNCIWVWNPNGKSFPDFKWNDELMYYPGDRYVNVVGLTAYNTGTFYEGENWNTFNELYNELYRKSAVRYSQPFMITEFASSSVGGDKSAWIDDMFDNMSHYPRIKAAVWWNGCDYADYVGGTEARPYYLQESQEILDTFRAGIDKIKASSPVFTGNKEAEENASESDDSQKTEASENDKNKENSTDKKSSGSEKNDTKNRK